MPYVISIDIFSTFDDAMKAAKDSAEDVMVNEYAEKYSVDEIETEVANASIYITGPGFIDWWTIVKV